MYVKESFHESVRRGVGVENNNYRFLPLHSSGAARQAAEDECDVGTCCNYFTKIGAKPADSPTSATVCLCFFLFPPFFFPLGHSQTQKSNTLHSAAGCVVWLYAAI